MKFYKGFTLAEVLIVIAIVGIVAVVVLPTLVRKVQDLVWASSADVFQKRLNQALSIMNTNGTLAGKTSTKDFLNELDKNFKIAKICDMDKLEECFSDEFKISILDYDLAGDKIGSETKVQLSEIKSENTLRNTSYGTGVQGVVFVNGVTALIEYNPECKEVPFDNSFNGLNCLAMYFDVNGNSNPNTTNKDIHSLKTKANGSIKFAGKIWTEPKFTSAMSYDDCLKLKDSLGIRECATDYYTHDITNRDFWAGAVKECGGIDKMPTKSDLSKLAEALAPSVKVGEWTDIGYKCETYPNCLYTNKAEKFLKLVNNYSKFYIWSGEEQSSVMAYRRLFYKSSYSNWTLFRDDSADISLTVCLSE